jgi:hypothetical protein
MTPAARRWRINNSMCVWPRGVESSSRESGYFHAQVVSRKQFPAYVESEPHFDPKNLPERRCLFEFIITLLSSRMATPTSGLDVWFQVRSSHLRSAFI